MSVNELASTRPFFTKSIHREVYDAIDPTKPSLALPGKTVLVTGAARGIGITIVESFAKAHAKTIILVGRSASALSSAQTKFEQSFPDVHFIAVPTDIGEPQSVDALFAGLKTQVDHIDILVNNAGVLSEYGPKTGDSDVDKWWTDMVINARGPYLLARGLIKFNAPDSPATFITLTTGVAEPFTNMNGYLHSKVVGVKLVQTLDAGVHTQTVRRLMGLCADRESTEYPNLRTFAVIPGLVETDMLLEAMRGIPLDQASLVGGVSVYLSHPHADFLSGRFLDSRWDIDQVVERKEEIVQNDLLKLMIAGY
ncbi:SubName: Full=Related to peroxisomal short-chain alcohol dehydrogenase {ECO:0000313/EMBL:CCA70502.1} [Serendipita indica DSM 11827]|nr:SubName: Full=Related to peroxisomal short-chain alcohol dehydrogenase {ECO:0000313/EMBL:CCA70502.1} [Serendipita indica DSM 11827]